MEVAILKTVVAFALGSSSRASKVPTCANSHRDGAPGLTVMAFGAWSSCRVSKVLTFTGMWLLGDAILESVVAFGEEWRGKWKAEE